MNKKAFTLIELLVVVLIIGILAAIALPQYRKAVDKTRLMEMLVQGRALLEAQQLYVTANGSMSTALDELDIKPVSGWFCGSGWCGTKQGMRGVSLEVSRYHGVGHLSLMCKADKNDDYAQQLCLSIGGIYSHESGGIIYYMLHKK